MLLGYAKAGLFRLDLSEDILNETARVLRDKFRRDGYSIHESDQRLRSIVSEDKGLLRLGNFEGAPVVTIREFHATSSDTASLT